MTDDFDIVGLIAGEGKRRDDLLDKIVHEQLENGLENCADDKEYLAATAAEHADELMAYSLDFEDEKWCLDHNLAALRASCQRWLDARRSAVQA